MLPASKKEMREHDDKNPAPPGFFISLQENPAQNVPQPFDPIGFLRTTHEILPFPQTLSASTNESQTVSLGRRKTSSLRLQPLPFYKIGCLSAADII